MKKEFCWGKTLIAALLVLVAVISFFPLANLASSPKKNADIITSIDSKVETVMKLTATSTVASAAVSAIPGDTATPIAEKLADFSEDFLTILCVLYTEKYLLTIIGLAVFRFAIPVACGLLMISVFGDLPGFCRLGIKLGALALCMYFAIPGSIRLADTIYDTYEVSINTTIEEAQQFSDTTSGLSEANEDAGLLESILNTIADTTTGLTDKAAAILNRFVETVAVLIVTSCVLPLLGLLFFLWLINLLTGTEIIPLANMKRRHGRRRHAGAMMPGAAASGNGPPEEA